MTRVDQSRRLDNEPSTAASRPVERPTRCAEARRSSRALWRIVLTGAALIALVKPAGATDESPECGVVSLLWENDAFYKTDRDYTNGLAVIWVPGGSPEDQPRWATGIAHLIPWVAEESRVQHGFILGQNMYTPNDTSLPDPPPGDRPYAGWLYGGVGVAAESGLHLDELTLNLGMVGPSSLAEETQKFIHSEDPQGWDTQLHDEFGFFFTYLHGWNALARTTVLGLDLDVSPHLGGALGTVHIYGNGGLVVRFGPDLPVDHGPPRVLPGILGTPFFSPSDSVHWYVFAGVEGRAVARNVFLDGNTFGKSRSVDKEPLVGDLQWGAVVSYWRLRLSYTHVVRTREFETQHGHDSFGALSLSVAM